MPRLERILCTLYLAAMVAAGAAWVVMILKGTP